MFKRVLLIASLLLLPSTVYAQTSCGKTEDIEDVLKATGYEPLLRSLNSPTNQVLLWFNKDKRVIAVLAAPLTVGKPTEICFVDRLVEVQLNLDLLQELMYH
jgi:hypothetical protein